MKLTKENLDKYLGKKMVFFAGGQIDGVYTIDNESGTHFISNMEDNYNVSEFSDMFELSDIKMPSTTTSDIQTALEGIEPKDKTCLTWFNECEDLKLRAACLSEMDGDLASTRNAISLLDAMELGLFIEDNENGKYLTRVINNLKALSK